MKALYRVVDSFYREDMCDWQCAGSSVKIKYDYRLEAIRKHEHHVIKTVQVEAWDPDVCAFGAWKTCHFAVYWNAAMECVLQERRYIKTAVTMEYSVDGKSERIVIDLSGVWQGKKEIQVKHHGSGTPALEKWLVGGNSTYLLNPDFQLDPRLLWYQSGAKPDLTAAATGKEVSW